MIDLKNAQVVYGNGQVAVEDLSVHIMPGEFVIIVGSSGAGKSTFIKLLTREIRPSRGTVIVNNTDLTRLKKSKVPFYRRKLGVVFQDFRLLPNKTVFENVAFALEVIEAKSCDIKRRVNNVLDMVGILHKAKELPHNLSGGEQQRVAIARAIVNKPLVLIADEPTGNLDPNTSKDIMDLFKRINNYGTTVVMVTHDMDMVKYLNKRVINIEQGRIIKETDRGALR